jgi:ribonucleotide reductase beta subunit family protein with ferritin-like domain
MDYMTTTPINFALKLQNIIDETFLMTTDAKAREFYNTQLDAFWNPKEVSFVSDKIDYEKLPHEQKETLKKVICFFTISDAIVADNALQFALEAENQEILRFYVLQAAIENVHNETYSLMSKAIFDHNVQNIIIEVLNESSSIIDKRNFVETASKNQIPSEKLFLFICIEGIFFAGSFAIIMWFKRTSLCKGIIQGNELILRDEELHWKFGCYRFNKYFGDKLTFDRAKELLEKCYEIEFKYCREVLLQDLTGMTVENLQQHIRHLGTTILKLCGFDVQIEPTPLEFADMVKMTIRTNFFESINTNYTKGCINQFRGYDPDSLNKSNK